MLDPSLNDEWMGVTEACEFLDIGKTTLYEYMSHGDLAFFHLAETGHRRIRKSDLLNLLLPGKPDFSSPITELQKWLKVSAACAYLKVTKPTLYTYMTEDRLPYYYLKGTQHRRVKQSDLDALFSPGSSSNIKPEDNKTSSDELP